MEELNTEQIELEEFTETIETVEETQEPPIEYTEAIYNAGTYIVSVILFSVFAVLGFLTITHIIGRAKL